MIRAANVLPVGLVVWNEYALWFESSAKPPKAGGSAAASIPAGKDR
jgi:hypothetical protein